MWPVSGLQIVVLSFLLCDVDICKNLKKKQVREAKVIPVQA